MVIVTHEMKFARDICNRVFYVDQGGIYEDGTPQQIFDNPLRERTRQFVHRLKVLEFSIITRDFDFIGLNTQIEEFGRKHRISQRMIYRLQSYFEEMCVQLILPRLQEDFEIRLTIAYSEEKDEAQVRICYGPQELNPLTSDNALSLLLANKVAQNIHHSYEPGQRLSNTLSAQIHNRPHTGQ